MLCNHQRAVGKAHDSQMEKLQGKLAEMHEQVRPLAALQLTRGAAFLRTRCCHALPSRHVQHLQTRFTSQLALQMSSQLSRCIQVLPK